ncbi:MAG TPA: amino acid ABC transporter ATP-binding protein [Acetobacteraceae bacterium]
MPALLQATNIHKRFGALEVLKGIDLEVDRGEVVALIGSSGSGKTTFLRCVNMLEEYHEGEIRLDDESIGYRQTASGRQRLAERAIVAQRARIGIVFQSYNLFPHLTAEQNITLGLTKVLRKPAAEARDIAAAWLERVGLADRRGHYPYQLSGGQQQRVAIARAVAAEPKLVLFDEVTSALDPELVGEVLEVMRGLAEAGMTMLVVSHEMLFVRAVATRVVFMDGGRIAEQGAAEALFRNPATDRMRSFLGRFHGVFR